SGRARSPSGGRGAAKRAGAPAPPAARRGGLSEKRLKLAYVFLPGVVVQMVLRELALVDLFTLPAVRDGIDLPFCVHLDGHLDRAACAVVEEMRECADGRAPVREDRPGEIALLRPELGRAPELRGKERGGSLARNRFELN